MPQRPAIISSLFYAGLATIPYLAINFGQIVAHEGSFIHFSKLEALMFTVFAALFLCVESAAVLSICAFIIKNRKLLRGLTAIAAFSILATALEPRFWVGVFDLLNDSLAEWIFRTGVLATALSLIFQRWAISSANGS